MLIGGVLEAVFAVDELHCYLPNVRQDEDPEVAKVAGKVRMLAELVI